MKKNMLAEIIGKLLASPLEPLPEPLSPCKVLLRDIEAYHVAWDLASEPSEQVDCFWRRTWGDPPVGYRIIYLEKLQPVYPLFSSAEVAVRDLEAWMFKNGSVILHAGYSDDGFTGMKPNLWWCDQ